MEGSKSASETDRFEEIKIVMAERSELVKICDELLPLLEDLNRNELEIQKKLVRISAHLANISGFCDKDTRTWIDKLNRVLLSPAIVKPLPYSMALRSFLIFIVGIQVDFTKRPFRVMAFNLKALGAEFKALLKK